MVKMRVHAQTFAQSMIERLSYWLKYMDQLRGNHQGMIDMGNQLKDYGRRMRYRQELNEIGEYVEIAGDALLGNLNTVGIRDAKAYLQEAVDQLAAMFS